MRTVSLAPAILAGLAAAASFAAGCGGSSDSANVVNNATLSPASGTTLAATAQGAFFQQRFTVASGGTSPYTFQEFTDGLPEGLYLSTIDSSGQALSTSTFTDVVGFAQVAAVDSLTFRVLDAESKATDVEYGLTVTAATTTVLTVAPATGSALTSGTVGAAYTYTLTVANGAPSYAWQVVYGALPPGLTFVPDPTGSNSAEATIRGTPTAAGTWIFAVRAQGGAGGVGGSLYQLQVQ